jgi:glycosyltransferase involved in cell wall biosynthesis
MGLFSVIIPTYNRSTLIGRTLDSVLAAVDAGTEILVVDDGSTDGTLEMLGGYGGRIKILQQANKGPGAARNAGLREATGDYAAFLDSDDLWFPWTAATYTKAIAEHHQPAFIAGKPFVFESDESKLPKSPQALDCLVFPDYFASGDQWRWYSASSFVMRREALLAAGGFTDEWVNGEDADAAMRIGVAGTFVQVRSPVTFAYRKHAGSAMSNLARTYRGMRRLIDGENTGAFPGGPSRARERRRIISEFARPLAVGLLDQGERRLAWDLYRGTFAWNMRLGRWKFLAGFPVHATRRIFRSTRA